MKGKLHLGIVSRNEVAQKETHVHCVYVTEFIVGTIKSDLEYECRLCGG